MLDRGAVIDRYDQEMRRYPVPEADSRVEEEGRVVRVVGAEGWVLFADLSHDTAPRAVRDQVDYFRRIGTPFEWKTFGHDPEVGLDQLLRAAGLVPGVPETIVVLDLDRPPSGQNFPHDVEVRVVGDEAAALDAAAIAQAAFGGEEIDLPARYVAILDDPNQRIFVAYVDGGAAGSGRLGLPPGRAFAGLWAGGTIPSKRHRGVYRALVHARANWAREHGYRYLTVDAQETSRSILERLGFVAITTTRPWTWRPDASARDGPGATGPAPAPP